MVIILLGAPGSGKGTQAKIISPIFSIKHVSTGDMLREVANSDTDLGRQLSETLRKGEFVTDELVNEIVEESLNKPEYKSGCILDGFPRTIKQAEFLDDIIEKDYIAIHFHIDKELLLRRIEGRFACKKCGKIYNKESSIPEIEGVCDNCGGTEFEKREDDNKTSLLKRLDIYEEQITDILDFYKNKNKLYKVDADSDMKKVTEQISNIIRENLL